jgi:hypothetical protein
VAPRRLSLIRKAAEAGHLDSDKFFDGLDKYLEMLKISYPEVLWHAAWHASLFLTGLKVDGPDMRLTLQLIARGGGDKSLDKERAIEDFYALWKRGVNQEFLPIEYGDKVDNCYYLSNGRHEVIIQMKYKMIKRQKEMQTFASALPPEVQKLLKAEEEAFYTYLKEKANYGEMREGTSTPTTLKLLIEKLASAKSRVRFLQEALILSTFIPSRYRQGKLFISNFKLFGVLV